MARILSYNIKRMLNFYVKTHHQQPPLQKKQTTKTNKQNKTKTKQKKPHRNVFQMIYEIVFHFPLVTKQFIIKELPLKWLQLISSPGKQDRFYSKLKKLWSGRAGNTNIQHGTKSTEDKCNDTVTNLLSFKRLFATGKVKRKIDIIFSDLKHEHFKFVIFLEVLFL